MKGLHIALVTKQKNRPKNMDMGNAGNAFRHIASRTNVRHKPTKMATKQAIVVAQSP